MLLVAEIDKLQQKIADLEYKNSALRQVNINACTLLENFPSHINYLTSDKELTSINKQLESLREKSVLEINNSYLFKNVHPKDKVYFLRSLMKAFRKEKKIELEFRFKNENNQYIWLHSIGNPIHNNENEFIGYICSSHDITKNKKDQQKLNDLLDSNKRLFSVIGHDLRNTFNSILGYSELLSDSAQDFETTKIKTIGSHIQITSKKTLNLLENLLEWGQLQNSFSTFTPKELSIKKACEEVLANIPLKEKDNHERIKIIFDSEINAIADVNMLRTVLRNLLSNALKYSHSSSLITINATTNQDYVNISIHDQGVGIAPEDISKLFNIRQRNSSKGIHGEKGTGLGLILCKEFIKKNNGKIWVKSTLGKGSEFSFSLPLSKTNYY